MSNMKQENASTHDIGQIDYGSHGNAVFFPIFMKVMSEYLEEDRWVLQQAVSVLERWMERFYARDILKYDTWYNMLLKKSLNASDSNIDSCNIEDQPVTCRKEDSPDAAHHNTDWCNNAGLDCETYNRDNHFAKIANDELLSRLQAQKDDIQCLIDDRSREAKYLLELAAKQKNRGSLQPEQLEQAARHLQKVSAYAEEIRYLIGDGADMNAMLRHLTDRKIREELAQLILYARAEDEAAQQCIKAYLQ